MSLYDDLKSALFTSNKTFFPSNELIFSHQGGPEPKGSYVGLNILRTDKIGMEDEQTYASGTPTITSKNVYEVTVRYMFVGKDSGSLAYEFEAALSNSAARFAFGTENLAIMRCSEIRRVPEKRDTTWVEFFTLDIVFSYGVFTEQPIDIIETISWEQTIIP